MQNFGAWGMGHGQEIWMYLTGSRMAISISQLGRSKMIKIILGTIAILVLLASAPAIARFNSPLLVARANATEATAVISTSDWRATADFMPGPRTPSLYVEGMVKLPNPGYEVNLVEACPGRRGDAEDLRLKLEVREKEGMYPQVITTRSVRYEDSQYSENYESAIVQLPDGSNITVDIQEVE
jgi:hypothetical protein